jgi:hypothetical protein
MSDKKVFSKNHTRIDKMGGVTKDCLHEKITILVDELGYTGTRFLNEGIELALTRHGLIQHGDQGFVQTRETIVPIDLKIGREESSGLAGTATTE